MAASGAKVLAARSVEFARNHDVTLHVRSTFTDDDGTWIGEEDERMLEKAIISGVTHTVERGCLRRARRSTPARLFAALADASVNVDTIIQNGSDEIVFSLADRGPHDAERRARRARRELELAQTDLGKVSVDRRGHEEPPGRRRRTTFATLAELGDQAARSSRRRRSRSRVFVPRGEVERAVQALHEAFELVRPRRSAPMPERAHRRRRRDRRGRHGDARAARRARLRARARVRVGAVGRARSPRRRRARRRGGDARGARARRRRPLPLLGRHDGVAASSCRHAVARRRRLRSTSRPPTGSSRASRSSCPR